MAFIFYDTIESAKNFSPSINPRNLNPNTQWAHHSYNHFVLSHISRNTPDPKEREQAKKELMIAERKINYWQRSPAFHLDSALRSRKNIYGY